MKAYKLYSVVSSHCATHREMYLQQKDIFCRLILSSFSSNLIQSYLASFNLFCLVLYSEDSGSNIILIADVTSLQEEENEDKMRRQKTPFY